MAWLAAGANTPAATIVAESFLHQLEIFISHLPRFVILDQPPARSLHQRSASKKPIAMRSTSAIRAHRPTRLVGDLPAPSFTL